MSEHFDEVMRYYKDGLWSIERVRAAVGRWITEAEFQQITGESFKDE